MDKRICGVFAKWIYWLYYFMVKRRSTKYIERKGSGFGAAQYLPLLAEAELIGDGRRNAGGQHNEK
ncbi:MAG: hypothetical protein C4548_16760 [Desulfobacteraceae bacterium]|jgi:hypothetical protein|nr:MAG: hypothetical protein C4548_16760 [Desulfobacteraceae bacterium]